MATAKKNPRVSPAPPDRADDGPSPSLASHLLRLLDSVYRFLASLKLAVISLGTLAFVLSYATFFEKWHGTAAVQEWIYQSKGFAVLLAFLGANILCAALIRFPWKKRQTGFVVTHAGLLLVLAGSWYALMTSDEGQVAALENEVKSELVRRDYPVVRVRQVDPHDPKVIEREWELPFRPGSFPWGPGQPRPRSFFASLNPLNWFPVENRDAPVEVLTKAGDPFRLVVKSHIPASIPSIKHVADPSGSPMVKLRPVFKAPGMPEARDLFTSEEERWFASDQRIHKVVREVNPAQFVFYYVDRPELVEDFLNPPAPSGKSGTARFRYTDKAGRTRSHDWALEGQDGKTVTLPESDLSVKFLDLVAFPAAEAGLGNTLGARTVPIAEFEVSRGGGAPVKHFALAALPMFPNVIPSPQAKPGEQPRALVSINYDLPPVVDPQVNGLFGVVEVLGTKEGTLYSRVWGRPEEGEARSRLRSKGPLKLGESQVAFGGGPNMPMTLSFSAEEYLTAGIEKQICEPYPLPPGQMGEGIAASLVEMTVADEDGKERSKEFFIRRSNSLDQLWQPVTFPGARYEISYDVDRRPLGFEIKMVDFDRGFDPGTEQASRFQSDVLLTDASAGIKEKPFRIEMNEPLTHRGYTFYQSSYIREQDPRTGRETGRVQSVLQVGKNPGRSVIYLGCLLVCVGTFLQFYMRAGLFSDGGRREAQRAAAKAVKAATRKGLPVDPELLAAASARPAPRQDADDETL
ncbi:MAG: cytochrome c biogenesis protein ResB [Isosphaeraceae bacterium]